MQVRICPFSATLVKEEFRCRNANPIIRRGGAEIACAEVAAQMRCSELHRQMKAAALPEFGVEDDPLLIPHGVQLKIQFGGLSGLQRVTTGSTALDVPVSDIDALVRTAVEKFASPEQIPWAELRNDITTWKLPRRRGR